MKLEFAFWLPGLFATIFLILMNLPPWESIHGDSGLWGGESRGAQAWFLASVTGLFACLAASLWVFGAIWGIKETRAHSIYPGLALVLQNIFIVIAAFMYRFARSGSEDSF